MINGNLKGSKEWWFSLKDKKIVTRKDNKILLVVEVKILPKNLTKSFYPATLLVKEEDKSSNTILTISILEFDIFVKRNFKIKFNIVK